MKPVWPRLSRVSGGSAALVLPPPVSGFPRIVLRGIAVGAAGGLLMILLHFAWAERLGRTSAAGSLHAPSSSSRLLFPVEGAARPGLERSFYERRGRRRFHEAVDIGAPRGTPVRAVDDGTLSRLGNGVNSGLAVEQRDPLGNRCYVYAHLDRFAPDLREGQRITRGQLLGYVGSTGNAAKTAPHLHFAVFRVVDAGSCWKGAAENPVSLFE